MKKIVNCLFIIILFSFFASRALAIGQMTQPIVVENALRGQEYQKKLTLLNSSQEEMVFKLKAEGDIAEWTGFYKIDDTEFANPISEISVPADRYLDAMAKFDIPDNLPNGEYKGIISVNYTPPQSNEATTSSALTQSIGRQVTINVNDQESVDFSVSVIPESYDLGPDKPLKIRIIYDNQSNIRIEPQIDLKIKKDDKSVYSAIFPFPEDAGAVKPDTRQEISALTIPTNGWDLGVYSAVLAFGQGDFTYDKKFTFHIRENVAAAESGLGNLSWINLLLGVLAIGLLGIFAYLLKKNFEIRRQIKKS